jgi:lysozyme
MGIDVSHYQGDIDWGQVKDSGITFAFLKATEGTTFVDDTFSQNLQNARSVGIKVGAYHFMRAASASEARREADFFIEQIRANGGFELLDLPPVLDIEIAVADTKSQISAIVRAWVNRVIRIAGRQPLIYTYPYFADQYLDASLNDIPLWLANYGVDQPKDRSGWTHWTFLQYSDKGQVPGIQGNVDMNEYEGTVEDLEGGVRMNAEDANKIIAFLAAAYECTDSEDARAEFHRLANELRKVSGQPAE